MAAFGNGDENAATAEIDIGVRLDIFDHGNKF